jgi:hypothetical protein
MLRAFELCAPVPAAAREIFVLISAGLSLQAFPFFSPNGEFRWPKNQNAGRGQRPMFAP